MQHDSAPVVQQHDADDEGARPAQGVSSSSFSSGPKFRENCRYCSATSSRFQHCEARLAMGSPPAPARSRADSTSARSGMPSFSRMSRRARLGVRVGEQAPARSCRTLPRPARGAARARSARPLPVRAARPPASIRRSSPAPRLVDAREAWAGVAALFGNQVQAAPAMPFRLQPVLGDQPEDARAQQAFIDTPAGPAARSGRPARWRRREAQARPPAS